MYNLTEHRYSDKPRRCYVDGVRVSLSNFDVLKERCHSFGRVFNMQTRCYPYGDGKMHRVNTMTVSTHE